MYRYRGSVYLYRCLVCMYWGMVELYFWKSCNGPCIQSCLSVIQWSNQVCRSGRQLCSVSVLWNCLVHVSVLPAIATEHSMYHALPVLQSSLKGTKISLQRKSFVIALHFCCQGYLYLNQGNVSVKVLMYFCCQMVLGSAAFWAWHGGLHILLLVLLKSCLLCHTM